MLYIFLVLFKMTSPFTVNTPDKIVKKQHNPKFLHHNSINFITHTSQQLLIRHARCHWMVRTYKHLTCTFGWLQPTDSTRRSTQSRPHITLGSSPQGGCRLEDPVSWLQESVPHWGCHRRGGRPGTATWGGARARNSITAVSTWLLHGGHMVVTWRSHGPQVF